MNPIDITDWWNANARGMVGWLISRLPYACLPAILITLLVGGVVLVVREVRRVVRKTEHGRRSNGFDNRRIQWLRP